MYLILQWIFFKLFRLYVEKHKITKRITADKQEIGWKFLTLGLKQNFWKDRKHQIYADDVYATFQHF